MADLTLRLVKGSPLTNAEVDANFSNLNEAITVGSEPMGHEDKTQSTLAFDAGTRTVTIAPVSGSFTVWVKGKKFVFTTAQTVVIPNTTGLHYVYFNTSGVLSSHMTYFDWPNEAPTAYVAWNAATGAAPFFADERHGVTLDWQTHEYLHRTRGAALANGFSISNYTVSGTGSADADAQLDLSGGTFFDEDLQVDITHSNTPVANTWQQDLAGPARIPVLYRSGAGWVLDSPTNFILKAGTATPRYNTESGGVWGLTDVPNNSYSAVWVIATNNLTYPVVAVMGQAVDSNAAQAENFEWSGLNLDGFPSVEFRPLYKIIFQCSTGYANTIKARFTKVFDNRNIVAASPAATIGSSHGGLSGLGADDHLQYLHVTDARTPSAAVKNSFLPPQTGNSGKFLSTDGSNPSWATMTAPNNGTLTLNTSGSGLSGSASFTADQAGNSTFTVTIASASTNTADTLVLRDGSGNFSANVITANSFSGSASGLTGFKTVNGNNILGSGNIQIDGGVTSFNTRTGAITLSSADVTGALGYTPYNSTNPNGYTSNAGTVTGVTAGTGLSGGTITSSGTISLATSGVTAGTYTKVTVDAYGRATSGASLSSSDVTTALGYTPYNSTNPSGYITGITSGMVTTALGYTPYNSTNPSGYITSSALSSYLPLSGGTITGFVNISTGTGQPLRLTTSSGGPWALELYRSDTVTSTKVYHDGARWYFEHRPSFAGATPLDSSNYTSYSPSLTGSGASGTWGISVTGNAATAGGLSVHSGRNNEVNKIVRTDSNGYIQAGWINTDSGDSGVANRLARIYSSHDAYLRYSALTDFKVHMGLSYKNNYSRRIDYTTDLDYAVGSMGHSGYGANETFHGGSGFFDIWSGTNYPSGRTHIHGFNALHYTTNSLGSTGGNAYGIQVAGQYNQGGELWSRGCSGGSFSSWRLQLDSSNYTSYAPTLTGSGASGTWGISITGSAASATNATYATSAGSATNASAATNATYATSAGSASNASYASSAGYASNPAVNYNNDSNSTYQMVWGSGNALYGTAGIYCNPSTDYMYAAAFQATSDESLKTNWRGYIQDFVEQLARVKHGTYDRIDGSSTQDGVSAQSLRTLLPHSVGVGEGGVLTVNYGNAAMVSAIELAKRVVDQEARIKHLESLIAKLIGD